MIYHQPIATHSGQSRAAALSLAVVLRNCSLKPKTPIGTRQACRVMMREQAFKWRQTPDDTVGPGLF